MFLKNYTSDVPSNITIGRIERVLIQCGVSSISKEYGPSGEIIAIRFQIALDQGKNLTVRLPADRNRALDALWDDYSEGCELSNDGKSIYWPRTKKKRRSDFADQAERTAWKLVQDWVEVQMSMIQMKQADTVEVFMPYVWDGKTTLYQRLKESGFRGLLPEHSTPTTN